MFTIVMFSNYVGYLVSLCLLNKHTDSITSVADFLSTVSLLFAQMIVYKGLFFFVCIWVGPGKVVMTI